MDFLILIFGASFMQLNIFGLNCETISMQLWWQVQKGVAAKSGGKIIFSNLLLA